MFPDPDILLTLHTVLLCGFLAVTVLLLGMTAANRLRMPRAVCAWRVPRRDHTLLWPGGFLVVILLLMGYLLATGREVPALFYTGYLMGGTCWWLSVRLAQTVLVTEFGILRDINRRTEGFAWGQVADYVEVRRAGQRWYTFLYDDETGHRRRLDLCVPPRHQAAFGALVLDRLAHRFTLTTEPTHGKTALEG